ncbi:MAG TPA: nuclease-related domain-containing protein, partial [Rhodanobacter sp.]|nr:nuclease-related domain-containing protein [Rhodanobacter sp.]
MILKSADDRRDELARLQQQTKSPDAVVAKVAATALRMRAAGANNEDNAAYFIDFGYAKTPNWVVIHDLRLESHGRTAQIDHLLICRTYEFYVLESKHFRAGVKITETGEFMRWDDYRKTY